MPVSPLGDQWLLGGGFPFDAKTHGLKKWMNCCALEQVHDCSGLLLELQVWWCCAFPLPDVLVWVKTISQGQHPTLHLKSPDPMVMNGSKEHTAYSPFSCSFQEYGTCQLRCVLIMITTVFWNFEKLFTKLYCKKEYPLLHLAPFWWSWKCRGRQWSCWLSRPWGTEGPLLWRWCLFAWDAFLFLSSQNACLLNEHGACIIPDSIKCSRAERLFCLLILNCLLINTAAGKSSFELPVG